MHIAKLLAEEIRQGWKVFDFLSGDEDYKYRWTPYTETATTVILKGDLQFSCLGVVRARVANWLPWSSEPLQKIGKHNIA